MISTLSSRAQALVILPAKRRWPWHDRFVDELRERFDVRVIHEPSAFYPWPLRARLNLERTLFAGVEAPGRPQWTLRQGPAPADDCVIFDLSESPRPIEGRHVFRPTYDGSPDTMTLVGRLLEGENPLVEVVEDRGGRRIAASYAAVEDKDVLGRGLAQVFARTIALLTRAGEAEKSLSTVLLQVPPRSDPKFRTSRLALSGLRLVTSKIIGRAKRRSRLSSHWNVAWRWYEGQPDVNELDLTAFTSLENDPARFFADPFVLKKDDRYFLFAEEFPYQTGKGLISCVEFDRSGPKGPFRPALERPYHLSYPYVIEREDGIFMIPETSSSGGLEIYRTANFPYKWEMEWRLFEGLKLVDPTLFEHEGRLWLFAGKASSGGSSWDELHAWHATALKGPWTPHALNPIKSDCRSARPGGRPLQVAGRLLRPAQRCERSYGESLMWLEITELTPSTFSEMVVCEWKPRQGSGISGLHSADLSTDLQVIDIRRDLSAQSN